ncbi:MAG TPA: 4Fe-4S dicluster domain-containing protein [Armatimonadota bacterium]|jgi:dissimilatory sulfite reductase (desulfoviridin) alpha/beta subunit
MPDETRPDRNTLKAAGLIGQKDPGRFSVRLRVVGGTVTAEKLAALARLSAQYGSGHVHLTTRQGLEIPNVRWEDIEALRGELWQAGLEIGGCGKRVRTITACQGDLCVHGLIDPQHLAGLIDGMSCLPAALPHKFKIGLTGCPNACIKPRENDLGVTGEMRKAFAKDLCVGCGRCVEVCPVPGVLRLENDRLGFEASRCVNCGKCVTACPTGAWQAAGVRYAIYVGGKMGRFPRLGDRLEIEITSEEQVLDLIRQVLLWFVEHAAAGERFADTVARLGVSTLAADLPH